MNKKVLMLTLSLLAVIMLITPMVSAKPTIKSVEFRVETWPAPFGVGDYSKWKMFPAGESGNSKLIRIPLLGVPPLVDDVPDSDPLVWIPLLLASRGGVRFTIGEEEPLEGTVEVMLIHSNTFADGSNSSSAKSTFIFDEGTLELSATTDKNGMGKYVGARGTGIFEGAKFTGTFEYNLYWYETYTPGIGTWGAGFSIHEGTGEIMFT